MKSLRQIYTVAAWECLFAWRHQHRRVPKQADLPWSFLYGPGRRGADLAARWIARPRHPRILDWQCSCGQSNWCRGGVTRALTMVAREPNDGLYLANARVGSPGCGACGCNENHPLYMDEFTMLGLVEHQSICHCLWASTRLRTFEDSCQCAQGGERLSSQKAGDVGPRSKHYGR